jgi:hypothetical protein
MYVLEKLQNYTQLGTEEGAIILLVTLKTLQTLLKKENECSVDEE